MSATEPPPLQALSDAVEDWLRVSESFYGELHERLAEAQQQLSTLETVPAPVSSGEEDPGIQEMALRRLQTEHRSLLQEKEALAAELSALREQLSGSDQLQNRLASLEEELGRERRRVRELQEALAEARAGLSANKKSAADEAPDGTFRVPDLRAFDAKGHKKRIGSILVDEGIVTPQQLQALLAEQAGAPHVRLGSLEEELGRERRRVRELQEALAEAKAGLSANPRAAVEESGEGTFRVPDLRAFDAKGHKKRIGSILVDEGIVTPQQLQALLAEQAGAPHVRLGSLAIERGYTSDALVAKVLAAQLRLPYVDLHRVQIEPKVLELLSSHLARLHRSLPLRQEPGRLILAMSNPLDLIAIEDIELATRLRVDPVVASAPAMETALEKFYPQAG